MTLSRLQTEALLALRREGYAVVIPGRTDLSGPDLYMNVQVATALVAHGHGHWDSGPTAHDPDGLLIVEGEA